MPAAKLARFSLSLLAFIVVFSGCKGKGGGHTSSAPVAEGTDAGELPGPRDDGKKATVIGIVGDDWSLASPPTSVAAVNLALTQTAPIRVSKLDGQQWLDIATDARVEDGRLIVHLGEGSYLLDWQISSERVARGFALVSAEAAANAAEIILRFGVASTYAASILEKIPAVDGGGDLFAKGAVSGALVNQLGTANAYAGVQLDAAALQAIAAALAKATLAAIAEAGADTATLLAALSTRPSPEDLKNLLLKDWTLNGREVAVARLVDAALVELVASVPNAVRGAALAATATVVDLTDERLGNLRDVFSELTPDVALTVVRSEASLPALQSIVAAIADADEPPAESAQALAAVLLSLPPPAPPGSEAAKLVASPLVFPTSGAYLAGQTVTMSSFTAGASLHYSLDGSEPTCYSQATYSAPVALIASTTLKVIACKAEMTPSSVGSFTYTIASDPHLASLVAEDPTVATLSWTLGAGTSAARVAYRSDGNVPTSRCVAGAGTTVIEASAQTSLEIIGLSPDTEYKFRVCGLTTDGAAALPGGVLEGRTKVASHKIFVSSEVAIGPSVGLAGVHAHCQATAVQAQLGGTWKAVIAASKSDVRDIIRVYGPVFNRGSPADKIASGETQLWSGTLLAPIHYLVDGNILEPDYPVATGVGGANGLNTASVDNCGNFVNEGLQYTFYGYANVSNATWVSNANLSCGYASYRFYCIDGQTTLETPSRVAARGIGDGSIVLSWSNIGSGQSGFEIQRSTQPSGPWHQINTSGPTDNSFVDTGLVSGATYYYRVRSVNLTTVSPFSFPASAKAQRIQRIFVSSQAYPSGLGGGIGLSAYDAACQSLAMNAELGGTWKAIMSSETLNARDRVVVNSPVYNLRRERLGGMLEVATGYEDLWDGEIRAQVAFDETGNAAAIESIWSGTDGPGGTYPNGHCEGFTSTLASSQAVGGSKDPSYPNWIFAVFLQCSGTNSVFCIDGQ